MIYPAAVIAYAFISKGIEERNAVSQMKLQKLLYFAHGFHLAAFDSPLIEDPICAWKFGPVIPDIYHTFKLYGSNPINDFNSVIGKDMKSYKSWALDAFAMQAVNETWKALKTWNAIQLSNWTHMQGSPWANNFRENINDIRIPDTEMKEYFKQYVKTTN